MNIDGRRPRCAHDSRTDSVVSGEIETLEFKATTGIQREAAAIVCAMLKF